jgi:hypothetical protein
MCLWQELIGPTPAATFMRDQRVRSLTYSSISGRHSQTTVASKIDPRTRAPLVLIALSLVVSCQ